jgi:hypothetical protein
MGSGALCTPINQSRGVVVPIATPQPIAPTIQCAVLSFLSSEYVEVIGNFKQKDCGYLLKAVEISIEPDGESSRLCVSTNNKELMANMKKMTLLLSATGCTQFTPMLIASVIYIALLSHRICERSLTSSTINELIQLSVKDFSPAGMSLREPSCIVVTFCASIKLEKSRYLVKNMGEVTM